MSGQVEDSHLDGALGIEVAERKAYVGLIVGAVAIGGKRVGRDGEALHDAVGQGHGDAQGRTRRQGSGVSGIDLLIGIGKSRIADCGIYSGAVEQHRSVKAHPHQLAGCGDGPLLALGQGVVRGLGQWVPLPVKGKFAALAHQPAKVANLALERICQAPVCEFLYGFDNGVAVRVAAPLGEVEDVALLLKWQAEIGQLVEYAPVVIYGHLLALFGNDPIIGAGVVVCGLQGHLFGEE